MAISGEPRNFVPQSSLVPWKTSCVQGRLKTLLGPGSREILRAFRALGLLCKARPYLRSLKVDNELMHDKSVEIQSPHIGTEWRNEEPLAPLQSQVLGPQGSLAEAFRKMHGDVVSNKSLLDTQIEDCRPNGIVVSDADCLGSNPGVGALDRHTKEGPGPLHKCQEVLRRPWLRQCYYHQHGIPNCG
ncbi:hypothetical protein TNCV_4968961 [Trichonephila clavipes]|nr:hypothetical protein TNCV_4968961 [Trichonephila clavipes]